LVAREEILGHFHFWEKLMSMAMFGRGSWPYAPRPGMLKVAGIITFRDESVMLEFLGLIRIEDGLLRAMIHYEPQFAIILDGAAVPGDICRILVYASDFPGITHTSLDVETVVNEEVIT
jgi:hypothetical protein